MEDHARPFSFVMYTGLSICTALLVSKVKVSGWLPKNFIHTYWFSPSNITSKSEDGFEKGRVGRAMIDLFKL